MFKITERIAPFSDFHDFLGYTPENCLFFDIETTGFSPVSSMVFLIGTLHREADGWILTQYLCEKADEEETLLRQFFQDADTYSTLIHFNGTTFDLPYLNAKLKSCGLPELTVSGSATDSACSRPRLSIDLYQRFRPLKKLLHLAHMNQSFLEQYIGWQRTDRLTGKHMAELFVKYAASGEPGLRELMLLHNHDDLIGMTRILCLSSYLILAGGQIDDVQVQTSDSSCDALCLSFHLFSPLPVPLSVPDCCALRVCGSLGQMTIPFCNGELLYFFPDYKNYYFLPLENQAVHKSIGQYTDRAYRTPAKPSNCYTRRTGQFLPQPEELFTPSFRMSWESAERFFEASAALHATEHQLRPYVASFLRTILQ